MIPLPLLCAVAPGRGRRRVLDRLARAEQRLADADATVAQLAAERARWETCAREQHAAATQHAHTAETLRNELAGAEMRIRELEAERTAARARRANEDTVTVPAPADDPQSAWFDGGQTAEIDVRPLWDAPFAQPAASPDRVDTAQIRVVVAPYTDPATNPAA